MPDPILFSGLFHGFKVTATLEPEKSDLLIQVSLGPLPVFSFRVTEQDVAAELEKLAPEAEKLAEELGTKVADEVRSVLRLAPRSEGTGKPTPKVDPAPLITPPPPDGTGTPQA